MELNVTCRKIDDASGGVWVAERRYTWDSESVDRGYGKTEAEALANLPVPRKWHTYDERDE